MRALPLDPFSIKDLLRIASRFSKEEGTTLLLSGGDTDAVQSSFLFLFPVEKRSFSIQTSVWSELESALSGVEKPYPEWVGFLSYELGAYADPHHFVSFNHPTIPGALFYRHACVIVYDHFQKKGTLFLSDESPQTTSQILIGEREHFFIKPEVEHISQSDTKQSYREKIGAIQDAIRQGDVYQVNLSQEFVFEGTVDPFLLFEQVFASNPVPFAAYQHCGSFVICSTSPERFLKKQGDVLETRPIKGTMPRGHSFEEDKKFRQQLLTSEKEKAELLMITDLLRNDLGKICRAGTIHVKELYRSEAYANVFHMLSVIEGGIKKEGSPFSYLRALFPGGSISGCPKLRAMELIYKLENRPRGIYTGAIGYIKGMDFDFNLAIRTLVIEGKRMTLQLGGGITIDSDPDLEYEETLHKGRSFFRAFIVD